MFARLHLFGKVLFNLNIRLLTKFEKKQKTNMQLLEGK